MSKVINEKGLLFLARLVLNLADSIGKEKAIQVIKNDPNLYIDLLADEHTEDTEKQVPFSKKKWSKEDLEKLRLTELQTSILETILSNKNSVSLTD